MKTEEEQRRLAECIAIQVLRKYFDAPDGFAYIKQPKYKHIIDEVFTILSEAYGKDELAG